MSISALQKEVYCFGEPENCVRHLLRNALAKDDIPEDVKPGDTQRLRELFREEEAS